MSRLEIALAWIAYCTWVIGAGGLLIWLGKKTKVKIHKKYRKKTKTVQPQIEVYGKNYKK
jgi:hypothetical protein